VQLLPLTQTNEFAFREKRSDLFIKINKHNVQIIKYI